MTYDEFLATKKRSEDLYVDAPHYAEAYDNEERPVLKGYVYDGYVIEELEDGRFYLILCNHDWIESDIAKLELLLFEYVEEHVNIC